MLADNPEFEKWCLETLRDLKPVRPAHSSPVSISDHGAEVFLGEAGVALLPETSDEWVLRLAFNGVTGWEYNSTLFTVWRAYLISEKLGDRFGELLNVVIMWSALRHVGTRETGYYGDGSQLEKYRCTLFKRLVEGRLKGPMISLERPGRVCPLQAESSLRFCLGRQFQPFSRFILSRCMPGSVGAKPTRFGAAFLSTRVIKNFNTLWSGLEALGVSASLHRQQPGTIL